MFYTLYRFSEAGRGAEAQSVTKIDWVWVRSLLPRVRIEIKWDIYLHLYFHFFALVSRQSAALSSATQYAMPPEFGGKWGTEWLNTFPLRTLLCAGYNVKLIWFDFMYRLINIFQVIDQTTYNGYIWRVFQTRSVSDTTTRAPSLRTASAPLGTTKLHNLYVLYVIRLLFFLASRSIPFINPLYKVGRVTC